MRSEAEKQLLAAIQEVEKFGLEDPSLATSLNNLAVLYDEQGSTPRPSRFTSGR